MTTPTTTKPKIFQGIVTSTKMQKTIVVAVKTYEKHPKYKKYLLRTKRYLAHDEEGKVREGDKVEIQETRPLSRRKSFTLVNKS
ncbi:30S ribosomal protein S17 [Candidatus Nomurabacteria bacterium]|nr:30S ribosomal protein S17 [Candidatus Nomurabacteria bacterium]